MPGHGHGYQSLVSFMYHSTYDFMNLIFNRKFVCCLFFQIKFDTFLSFVFGQTLDEVECDVTPGNLNSTASVDTTTISLRTRARANGASRPSNESSSFTNPKARRLFYSEE